MNMSNISNTIAYNNNNIIIMVTINPCVIMNNYDHVNIYRNACVYW